MVSWIREWGKTLDRPGKPKWVVRMNWERLKETPVLQIFNPHLGRALLASLWRLGPLSRSGVFRTFIAEAAGVSCGLKVLGSSRKPLDTVVDTGG